MHLPQELKVAMMPLEMATTALQPEGQDLTLLYKMSAQPMIPQETVDREAIVTLNLQRTTLAHAQSLVPDIHCQWMTRTMNLLAMMSTRGLSVRSSDPNQPR